MIDFDAVHGDNLTYYLTGPSWLKLDSEAEDYMEYPNKQGNIQLSCVLRIPLVRLTLNLWYHSLRYLI